MTKVVSLRQARKRAERAKDRTAAEANARAHGRSKANRKLTQAERARAERAFEGHRREPED